MKNRILKFELFKKGTPEQKPEKQVEVAGGMPKNPKEKPFDQVKRAKLAIIDKTEPDYSKVRKTNEAASAEAVKAAADKLAALQQQKAAAEQQIITAQTELTKAQAEMASVGTTTTIAPPTTTPPPAANAVATTASTVPAAGATAAPAATTA